MAVKPDFLSILDAQIQSKHLLSSAFYQAWSRGELSIECLQDYAKDYYHHVKAFGTYLSAIHARVEEMPTRRVLLQNLMEEEAGSPNHPDLWRNFALAIEVTEEELTEHQPSKEIQALISTFRHICSQNTIPEGIAALYAYESQIPEICISKIEGLKKHYGLHNPQNWEYFTVHIAADQEHAAQERSLLKNYANEDNIPLMHASVDRVLDLLQDFLAGLCHKHRIAQAC